MRAEARTQNSLCDAATVDKKAPREASVKAAAHSASEEATGTQIPADACQCRCPARSQGRRIEGFLCQLKVPTYATL